MCEPTTAMMILTAASAASGVMAQQQAADSQGASNARQAAALMASRTQNANQINIEQTQLADAAGQKINANNQAMRESQATAIARAGPSGLSVDALLGDMGNKGATYNQSVYANLDRTNLTLNNQLENLNTQTTSGFNSLKTPAPVDYLGAGLKIAGAYAGNQHATAVTGSSGNAGFGRYTKGNLGSGD